MEDWKKKYEELFGHVQDFHKRFSDQCSIKKEIEDCIPELAEDERIRKEIVGFIEQVLKDKNVLLLVADRIGDDIPNMIPGWLAYLEKQKENPKSAYSIPSDCVSDAKNENEHNESGDFVFELRQIISRHWYADEFSYRVDDEEGMASEIMSLCEKQKEQKPAEWSDSVAKEMFIKALERAVEQTKKGYELTDCDKHSWWEDFKAYSGIKPAEWSERHIADVFEKVGISKIVREQGNDALTNAVQSAMIELSKTGHAEWSEEDEWKRNELLKYLEEKGDYRSTWYSWLKFLPERFNPQLKQEWSEEDERILQDILIHLEGEEWVRNHGELENLHKWQYWLKSLSPRTMQKLSESEQKTLNTLIVWLEGRIRVTAEEKGEFLRLIRGFRPQPHWKPSEEQMDILDKVYHYLWADRNATADMQDGLGDFIDDLKSL